jgi:hypothetical protein
LSTLAATARKRKPALPELPKLIEKYYADLRDLAHQNVMFETGMRHAFHALLASSGRWSA